MKRITKFAVAGVAAMALTAGLGSASASAYNTVLCSKPGFAGCKSAEYIKPAGSSLGAATTGVGGFTLTGTFVNPRCNIAAFAVKTTAEVGDPLPGVTESLFECRAFNSNDPVCTKFSANSPSATIVGKSYGNGTVKIGTEAEPLEISFVCQTSAGNTQACTFKASGPVTQEFINNGNEAVIANTVLTLSGSQGNLPCGEKVTLNMNGYNTFNTYPVPKI